MTDDPEGILLIDKPQGYTSHDVVALCRKIFQIKKVGHAGTLDPMATGLLLILIGKATKVSQYLMSLDKEYLGTIYFGKETDSQDADGELVNEKPVPKLSEESLKLLMKEFLGDQYQVPPMFSAKKVNGKKLYKLAREGKTIKREPRVIRISCFDLLNLNSPKMDFIVRSSKGAYIRTLAFDFASRVGCGGHLSALRRTKIGDFSVNESFDINEISKFTKSKLRSKLLPISAYVQSHVL